MNEGRRGLCLVIAAPSGAGKSTITRALLAADPGLSLSISVTTRKPRAGEQEGVHYFFRDQGSFDAMAGAGALLEYAHVFGRSYGTPRAPVVAALEAGQDVLFDIDWQGHRQLRAALPDDVVSVFILPPSRAHLADRLRGRGDAEVDVARRMAEADSEMSHVQEFEFAIVNADLPTAVADASAILRAARLATRRRTQKF